MSDEVFSMTIMDDEKGPFLRRLEPENVFEYKGERWAVALCLDGYWVTHVDSGFALTSFYDSEEEAFFRGKVILDNVDEVTYTEKMAFAMEQRKEAEKRGFIEEMKNV